MHRAVLALAGFLVACEPALARQTLPELATAPAPAAPASVRALLLPAGERLVWEVRAGGLSLGRLELITGDAEVHSRFETGRLASAIAAARYELTTALDRGGARPAGATERLELGGAAREHTLAPPQHGAPIAHTAHTALGWVRAWASRDARATEIAVSILGAPHVLTLARPEPDEREGVPLLRVEGRVRDPDDPIAVVVWLTADAARVPTRFTVTVGGRQFAAVLVDGAS